MWIPQLYRVNNIPVLHGFMQKYNFADLVSFDGTKLQSTSLPFVVKPGGEYGILLGHIAKANPQSKTIGDGQEVMVNFHGPHAYISPNWYQNRQTAVPTWDHTTVCAYGVPKIVQEPDAVIGILQELVRQHEAGFSKPWIMEDASAYVSKLLPAVVAFEIPLIRIEGQFKLSQDRPTDFPGIIDALQQSNDSGERELAKMMQELQALRLKAIAGQE